MQDPMQKSGTVKKTVIVLAAVLCVAALAWGIAKLVSGHTAGEQGPAPAETGAAGANQQKQENQYYDSGKLKTEFVYDEKGRLAKTNTYDEDGTLSSGFTARTYDENGAPAEYTVYTRTCSADGIPVSEQTADYGPGSRLTRLEVRKFDGEGIEKDANTAVQ